MGRPDAEAGAESRRGRRWLGVAWARTPPPTAGPVPTAPPQPRPSEVLPPAARTAPARTGVAPEPVERPAGPEPTPPAPPRPPAPPAPPRQPEAQRGQGSVTSLPTATRTPRRPVDRDLPHARLGLAWAAALAAGALGGRWGLAAVLIPAAALAALEAGRIHELPAPYPAAAAGAAAVTVAAGLAGPVPILAISAAIELLTAALLFRSRRHPELVRRWAGAMVAVAVTVGPAAVVALATRSLAAATVLLAGLCLFDASAYVAGTGAGNQWEGPAAGAVSLVPFVVIVASVLDPPFRHGAGWIMGAAAILLMPLGPAIVGAVVGRRRVPATRRLDALLLAGPVWLVLAVLLDVH